MDVAEFMVGWTEAYNSADPERASQFIHLPLIALPPPPDPQSVAAGMLPTLTSVDDIRPLLPADGGYSTLDRFQALDAIYPLPHGARHGVVSTFTRHTRDGRAYLRVDAFYLLTEIGGRLGIKVAAQLAMTEISA